MAGILGIKFNERGRNLLSSTLVWLCTKCLITALINICFGVYLWIELHQHPHLIPAIYGDTMTLGFILSFMVAFLLNILKIKISLDFHSPYARLSWVPYINFIITLNCILTYALIALGSLCFFVKRNLRDNFDKEIQRAMTHYRFDLGSKVEMDRLQIDFHCCGKDSYRDWFNVTWLEHDQAIFKIIFAEAYDSLQKEPLIAGRAVHKMVDNVPWSCCDPVAVRPCIHYGVHHNNLHFNYDFARNTTLHSMGCLDQLTKHFGTYLIQYIIISSSVIGSIESLTLLLLMYLKSAIFESIKNEDLFADSMGYFMGGACFFRDIKSGYETLLRKKAEHIKKLLDPKNIEIEQAYRQWRRVSKVMTDKFGLSDVPLGKGKASLKSTEKISNRRPLKEVKNGSKAIVKPSEPLVPMSIIDIDEGGTDPNDKSKIAKKVLLKNVKK